MRTLLAAALLLIVSACASTTGGMGAPPPAPPPPVVVAPPPPAANGGDGATRGLGAPQLDVRPVLVDINRDQDRQAANGGSAVVVLSNATDPRSMWLCALLAQKFSRATFQTVQVGVRRDATGKTEAVRPLYWMTARASADNTCRARVAAYDFSRARVLKDRFGLNGAGPYLLVASATGDRVSHIDLSGRSYAEMDALVDVFRDAFAYENGIWDPVAQTSLRQGVATKLASRGFTNALMRSVAIAIAPSAGAGCRLNDLRDRTC